MHGMKLDGKRIAVIGGTSGIGFAAAKLAQEAGAQVTVASRSESRVAGALDRLGNGAEGAALDTHDEAAVEAFFAERTPFDHVVVSAAQLRIAAVRASSVEEAQAAFASKFWGAYRVARSARFTEGGSLTLVSGFLSARPKPGTAILAALNAGLEGLTRGLAVEFAPVRVNCVSPGLVMTEMYDRLGEDGRKEMFAQSAKNLPCGRIGKPEHIALQIMACISNGYMTGAIIYIDGGGVLC